MDDQLDHGTDQVDHDQLDHGLIRLIGILGVVSHGYIYGDFPMPFLSVFNLLDSLPIDLLLVAAQQLPLVTRPD